MNNFIIVALLLTCILCIDDEAHLAFNKRILSKENEQVSGSIAQNENQQIIGGFHEPHKNCKAKKYQFICGPIKRDIISQKSPQSDRKQLVSTIFKFNMYVDKRDKFVSQDIRKYGSYQGANSYLIGELVNPGNKVLNVGSQTGQEALVMAKVIGPTGKLFIFEPYWFSNYLVTSNINYNNFSDYTTIYKKGASDQKGSSVIEVKFQNTGFALINNKYKQKLKNNQTLITDQKGEYQLIEIDTVDNTLPKDIVLDFALIDAERLQAKVLAGMKQVIKRSPNLIIMVQWVNHLNNPGISINFKRQILQRMINNGYGIFKIPSIDFVNCKIQKLVEIDIETVMNDKGQLDILFIPLGHQILPNYNYKIKVLQQKVKKYLQIQQQFHQLILTKQNKIEGMLQKQRQARSFLQKQIRQLQKQKLDSSNINNQNNNNQQFKKEFREALSKQKNAQKLLEKKILILQQQKLQNQNIQKFLTNIQTKLQMMLIKESKDHKVLENRIQNVQRQKIPNQNNENIIKNDKKFQIKNQNNNQANNIRTQSFYKQRVFQFQIFGLILIMLIIGGLICLAKYMKKFIQKNFKQSGLSSNSLEVTN